VVSIEATNYMQFMNVTGVFGFHLPSLELSSPLANGYDDVDMSFDASLTPTHGGKGGVGGAIFLQFLNNTTHAIVEPASALQRHAVGLNIKAEEAIMTSPSRRPAPTRARSPSAAPSPYFEQTSDTLAHLVEGLRDHRRARRRYAGSLETLINWAGGVAKSKAIGAGHRVAITNIDRRRAP
jgi:hypothetical protein